MNLNVTIGVLTSILITASSNAAGDVPRTFKDCAECPEMVEIPAGEFFMGSAPSEIGHMADEGPRHRVRLQTFALARTEVTRSQFTTFARETGYAAGDECHKWLNGRNDNAWKFNWHNPDIPQGDDHPVVCVSWHDAQAYMAWLTRKTGRRYRLPSEAEWEYAARAGTTSAWHWGEDPAQICRHANLLDQAARKVADSRFVSSVTPCDDGAAYTAPVGRFSPNALGLFDMAGNVSEWTEDCWHDDYNGAPADGSVWRGGDCERRVLRGGNWSFKERFTRSADRGAARAEKRFVVFGFRPALTLK